MKFGMPHFFGHITAALSGTALTQIIAGIAQIIIIRALGVQGYGTYAYIYAILAIVAAVMGAGLDTWLLDDISRNPARVRASIRLISTIKGTLWLCAVAVLMLAPLDVPLSYRWLGMLIIGGDSLTNTLWQALRGLNRHRDVALFQPLSALVLLAGVFLGMAQQLESLLWLQSLNAIGIYGVVVIWVWRVTPATTHTIALRDIRTSIPFVVSDILAQTYTHSTTILLGWYLSHLDVGIFRGATSVVSYSYIFPAVIFSTTLPLLNHTQHHRRRIIIQSAGILSGYGLIAGVLILVLGTWGVITVYGADYRASADYITTLYALPFIKALSFWGALLLIHQQQLMRRIVVQIIVVTCLWGIAPTLIATYGIAGAITTQLLCETVLAIGYIVMGVVSLRLNRPTTTPPQHVYICNTHGVANVGDVAIHHQQLTWLRQIFPDARFTLSYRETPAVRQQFPNEHIVAGLSHWIYAADAIAPLMTRIRRTCMLPIIAVALRWDWIPRWGLTPAERQSLEALAGADIICASGGGYIYDSPTTHPFIRWWSWDIWLVADMLMAVWLHKPLYLLPQSIGPIHSPVFQRVLISLLKRATAIAVRESHSSAWLQQHDIPHHVIPDLAWRQQADPAPMQTHTLGITVIDWAQQYALDPQVQRHYEDTIVAVCQVYLQRGWHITLFVQCHEAHPAWDDLLVAERIQARCPACGIAAFTPDPSQLQTDYSRMQVLLTTRLHAAILRLALHQPTVVIAYLPKAHGIMQDIGLGDWVCDYRHVSVDQVVAMIDDADRQRPILAQHVPQIHHQLDVAATHFFTSSG